MIGDPIPNITSARLEIKFADGRTCIFEAKDPGPAEVGVEHLPPDRILDRDQPAYPEMLYSLASIGDVGGVLLRLRAARDCTLRYLDVP